MVLCFDHSRVFVSNADNINPERIMENTFLFRGADLSDVYDKTINMGRDQEFECIENNKNGYWSFLGVKQLAEIMKILKTVRKFCLEFYRGMKSIEI